MLDCTFAYGLKFLFPLKDLGVGESLRTHGEFSRVETEFLLDHAPAGERGTLIDVGANIGSIALPFAQQRPSWQVLAVEAHRGLAGVLNANTLNNGLFNVEVFHAAAAAEHGILNFPASRLSAEGNFGTLGVGSEEEVEPVRALTLDELAPRSTRLVKLDIEGFEPEVLKGARGLILSRKVIWVSEASVQHPDSAAEVIRTFQEAGYGVYWFYVPFATPQSPKRPPVEPTLGDANIVALPPGVENLWDLRPVGSPTERRPSHGGAYAYLRRFGYTW